MIIIAVLGLIGQILLGAAAMPMGAAAAAFAPGEVQAALGDAAWTPFGVICHADESAPAPLQSGGERPASHHHAPDCALCPLCAAMAGHGAILTPAPPLPQWRGEAHIVAALPPPGRAPPKRASVENLVRGPPRFV